MKIFNCDGHETEMCGNGLRCMIRFLEDLGDNRKEFSIETAERTLKARNHGPMIAIEMGTPVDIRWNQVLDLDGSRLNVHHLNTGVPHAVAFVNFVHQLNLNELGPKIRHHTAFSPAGVNANFAQVEENEVITLRTFERGVEAETLACGTGATAVALAAAKIYGLNSPIAVKTRSQELLYISFDFKEGQFTGISLTGPAQRVFQGEFELPFRLIRTKAMAYTQ